MLFALLASLATAEAPAEPGREVDRDCYDAVVTARIVRQLPTVIPHCGADCIIMTWPWFVELDVRRVVIGTAPRGRLLTQVMLHNYYRDDLGTQRWWLRRNSLDGFNVLRVDDRSRPERCAADMPPANAHIRPGNGRTLLDLVREAEQSEDAFP